jgi:hypothetical protein
VHPVCAAQNAAMLSIVRQLILWGPSTLCAKLS